MKSNGKYTVYGGNGKVILITSDIKIAQSITASKRIE